MPAESGAAGFPIGKPKFEIIHYSRIFKCRKFGKPPGSRRRGEQAPLVFRTEFGITLVAQGSHKQPGIVKAVVQTTEKRDGLFLASPGVHSKPPLFVVPQAAA